MIDIGPYRRFYRQNRTSFAGAEDGAICAASTLSALSSIRMHLSALELALDALLFASLRRHPAEYSGRLLKPAQDGISDTR